VAGPRKPATTVAAPWRGPWRAGTGAMRRSITKDAIMGQQRLLRGLLPRSRRSPCFDSGPPTRPRASRALGSGEGGNPSTLCPDTGALDDQGGPPACPRDDAAVGAPAPLGADVGASPLTPPEQFTAREQRVATLERRLAHLRAWMASVCNQMASTNPQLAKNARRLYIGGVPADTTEVRWWPGSQGATHALFHHLAGQCPGRRGVGAAKPVRAQRPPTGPRANHTPLSLAWRRPALRRSCISSLPAS
jgi:hypothetical protein